MLAESRQFISTSAVALICVLGVGYLQVPQLQSLIASQKAATPQTLEKATQAEELRLKLLQKTPAFGFDNFFADWTYLNFIQYFGDDDIRAKTGYRLSPEYYEIIIKHDPRFLESYIGLSTSTSMYAAMPERSIALMDKGLQSLRPNLPPQRSYYVWRYKGIDQLLFLGNAPAAKESFTKAADWASQYSDPESQQVANVSRQTATFLARNPKSKSAQIAAWTMVLSNGVDERTKKIAINRIESLGGKLVNTPKGIAVRSLKED